MTDFAAAAQGIALDARALALRRTIVRTMASARRGHLGSAFSLAEILRVLFDDILNYRAWEPSWPDRDRFILSKGHGCLALYVLLAEKGFFPKEELGWFCAFEGILGGHPDARKVPGVEISTGSLGHGLPVALGMALAARMNRKTHRVFAVLGDGECNEGSVWEAALSAGKHGVSNLTVIVDYNKMQSYASTREVLNLEPLADKWASFGFSVAEANGHDVEALRAVLGAANESPHPLAVICHTVKGKGVALLENNASWHHKSRLPDDDAAALLAALGEAACARPV